jgi:hypothetical protein
MQIIVQLKNNYGTQTVYPVCENAKHFTKIAGTKTLTNVHIETIKQLGFEIKIKQDNITL